MADNAPSKIQYDDFIANVQPDPAKPESTIMLSGFIGHGGDGVVRIYPDPSLGTWYDVPEADVVHSMAVPDSKLGGSYVWVRASSQIKPGSAAAAAPAASEANATPATANSATAANANPGASRAEVTRLWGSSIGENRDLGPADRTYLAQVVAARTGLSQADAEKRIDQVVNEAKAAADHLRRGLATLSFWTAAALLFGAFAASLAAVEGGQLRDGTWNDRVLVPRTL